MAKNCANNTPPPLSAVWCLDSPKKLICKTCHNIICSEAVIRTFMVYPGNHECKHDLGSDVLPVFDRKMVFFYRHFDCLRSSEIRYISISHVWDPLVSKIQNEGVSTSKDESTTANKVSSLIFSEAISMYQGIQSGLDEPFEAWQDYMSVPQWEQDIKLDILLRIPDIYHHSWFTVAFWHDVEPSQVQILRNPKNLSTPERLGAITHVCNNRWYRRVWTAMEFIRSQKVRVMLKGYQLCEDGEDLFLHITNEGWREEGEKIGDIFELEKQAGINRNVMPWQVTGLTDLKLIRSKEFGIAFERLALRGCSTPLDFYYALLGLVGFKERLDPEPQLAGLQIAKRCLENQDYSPLLLVRDVGGQARRQFYGFIDLLSWGLGPMIMQAHHPIQVNGTRVGFIAQPTGQVSLLESSEIVPYNHDPLHAFVQPARIVLTKTGADVERFVTSLAIRLFAVNPYAILRRLKKTGRYEVLVQTLHELSVTKGPWPVDTTRQMIEDLGFNSVDLFADHQPDDVKRHPSFWKPKATWTQDDWTPMTNYMMHGRTIHADDCGTIIGMRCPTCKDVMVTRAAIWIPHEEGHGAEGYRIPGLHYERSLPSGVGFLVKNGEIIGRFLFGVPCCQKPLVKSIELDIPKLPLPCPNEFPYGEGKVSQQDQDNSEPPMVKIDNL